MNTDRLKSPTQVQSKLRILLYIGELSVGGAERQFVELAKGLHRRGIPVAVMLNRAGGGFYHELADYGIPLHVIDMRGLKFIFSYFLRARSIIRDFNPNVLYGFMGSGIKSSILTLTDRNIKIIWGVRNALTESYYKTNGMRIASALDRWFSPLPDALICNSKAGLKALVARGFRNKRIRVVSNGIDAHCYQFNENSRDMMRGSWGVECHELLIGMVGRLHPDKNHQNFMDAARIVADEFPQARFVVVGQGEEKYISAMKGYAQAAGLAGILNWVDHQNETAAVYSALDVLVSASNTEAFPNVLGEGMSCGLPVVATDVGDCSDIIGDRGWIVPVNDPASLAVALKTAIVALPNWNRDDSRQRIVDNYGIDAMVAYTLNVILEVITD